jgi:thioredoxin 1
MEVVFLVLPATSGKNNEPNLKGAIMKGLVSLTDDTFDSAIQDGLCVVEFWSPECRPCEMVTPALAELAVKYDGQVKFARVDADEQMKTAFKNRVLGVPTVIYFVNGRPYDVLYTSYPKRVYEERLSKLMDLQLVTSQ